MYSYSRQILQVLVWFSLGIAGATNLQTVSSLITGTRVGNEVVISAGSSSHDRELIPIEPVHRIEINTPRMS
ncbi:hypothetical protein IFO70_31805 [Phormidium tenue FACHB-886]|nr:hypothetical protein [Phormidium tenue FACHB-886]